MTKEEAIKYFERHLDLYCVDGISREAEEMAIQALESDYKAAFQIACALLNGDTLYGMDAESIFSEIMKKDGCVCSLDYENYILTHLNELRDDKALSQEPCDVSVSEKEPNEITEEVTLRFFKNSLKVRWHDFVIYNVEWLKKNWQMEMDIVCGVKPCDDAISRDMALEKMADYVASGYADSAKDFEEYSRIICQLPPVTQKPIECEDAVSRDELLKAIDTWDKFGYTETGCFVREPKGDYVPYIHYDDVIKCIKGMPTVTQKSGKWQVVSDGYGDSAYICECSECKDTVWVYKNADRKWKYCPNCGAKMIEPQENEEISERNMKMWEEIFKAESEDKK